ncbi:hypothetical protein HFO61_31660 [Rhizobium leguminosarum]|uniref:hypothetical protein n=1 Tax=Rhizobium leguminosarum TaxID=384 RepID=UPI001C94DB9D|nr:hypothetical protein [Rhizobium leguminosarum]MBY5551296.1 hypothetical protein [Rhizobium leguminosarum]
MLDEDVSTSIQRHVLRSVSSQEEFPRIQQPKNAEDYLLRLQADAINSHTRVHRVMLRRAHLRGSATLLFDEHSSDFTEYLSYLPEYERLLCEDTPRRYILTNNYDAMCLNTDFGKVIIVSEVLRYFLYFMNLATLKLGDVPEDVRQSALIIAVRSLLLNEALDFDMDPRGMVPADIDAQINEMVKWQMKFIIGHEYAHHILHHDSGANLCISRRQRFSDEDISEFIGYSRQHSQEFEADLHSISVVEDGPTQFGLFVGGTSFLLALYVFEALANEIDPRFAEINTHPHTATRIQKLFEAFPDELVFFGEDNQGVMEYYDSLVDFLIASYRNHPKLFTFYGSVYLGQWRGRILTDRKDF